PVRNGSSRRQHAARTLWCPVKMPSYRGEFAKMATIYGAAAFRRRHCLCAMRPDRREIRLHPFVALRVELTRTRPHVALRLDAGGDELQPFGGRVAPQ